MSARVARRFAPVRVPGAQVSSCDAETGIPLELRRCVSAERHPGFMLKRAERLLASLFDPRAYLHVFRLVHFWNYAHVSPLRKATIGSNVGMAPNVSLRNGERITIGSRARISEHCSLWAGDSVGRIEVGEDTLFGPGVYVTASNYDYGPDGPVWQKPRAERDVVIGANAWLGANVIVVPGVTIGDGCIVAAGSVVTRDLPPGAVAAGVPARVVKMRDGSAVSVAD